MSATRRFRALLLLLLAAAGCETVAPPAEQASESADVQPGAESPAADEAAGPQGLPAATPDAEICYAFPGEAPVDYDAIRNVLTALEREDVRYKVFGGVALNLHGLARATEDLDIFVAPEPDNIERLRDALRSVFDDPHIDEIDTGDLLGEYPAVQYIPPAGGFHIDILTRLGEVYTYESLASERLDFDGLEVTVVTPQTLYDMKKGTVRARDWGDAERLRRRFGLGE